MCCGPVADDFIHYIDDDDDYDDLCVAGLLPASDPACSSAACKQAAAALKKLPFLWFLGCPKKSSGV